MGTTLTKPQWHTYSTNTSEHTVVGCLQVAKEVYSPELKNQRDILVYLPRSYGDPQRRFPVLYMHDGQNLFDEHASFVGEWRVDETMEQLGREKGLEGIVVGIPNRGSERLAEYSPFVDNYHGGGHGNLYLSFIVRTLKPIIDAQFRTLPGRDTTGIMGSSMGGLISLYAFFRHPDEFGFCGAMSPSLWYAKGAIFEYVKRSRFRPGKLYLDAGTREMSGPWPRFLGQRAQSRRYYASVRRMKRVLVRKGYRPVYDLVHVEERWANHDEAAWSRRLPAALSFFLTEAWRHA